LVVEAVILNVARRVATAIAMLAIVSFLVFGLSELAPGDPAASIAGPDATPQLLEKIRHENGLDQPFLNRYARWASHAVRGDLGKSLHTSESISAIVGRALPVSMSLVGLSLLWSSILALIGGSLCARYPGSWIDRLVSFFSAFAVGLPSFCLALILASEFAVKRRWFPASGFIGPTSSIWLWLKGMVLPVITLSGVLAAELTRQLRGSLMDALNSDYVLTARAGGIRPGKVIYKHALKNGLIPVVTVFGLRFAQLVGGTAIIETMFNFQGLGSLAVRAAIGRDGPVLLGLAVFTTLAVQVINLLIDASQRYFNPKVRA
jgi:peptide/nickel transport system permease protein